MLFQITSGFTGTSDISMPSILMSLISSPNRTGDLDWLFISRTSFFSNASSSDRFKSRNKSASGLNGRSASIAAGSSPTKEASVEIRKPYSARLPSSQTSSSLNPRSMPPVIYADMSELSIAFTLGVRQNLISWLSYSSSVVMIDFSS